MYTKFKAKYDREYIDIEKELGNISVNVSNLKKITKFAVELWSKPLSIWENSDYHTRQSVQNLVFPNGISYNRELDQYRTTRINSFFAVISELVKGLRKNKRGEMINNNQIPSLVGPVGFEPTTLPIENRDALKRSIFRYVFCFSIFLFLVLLRRFLFLFQNFRSKRLSNQKLDL